MSLRTWFQKLVGPKAPTRNPIVTSKPLHQQFQRIGGGLTPFDVSSIIRTADSGQPARLIDLTNESRQKDGHFQSVCGTRDIAVSKLDLQFIEPDDATADEIKAVTLCERIYAEFRNWELMVEHLTGAYLPGHATCELKWDKQSDGALVPVEAQNIHPRDFIFAQADGSLRYRAHEGDTVGVDLLGENPGRIIQLQRRIVGDVPVREGLMRLLVWSALFRNWTLRDWIALGEVGWKPWRIGKYPPGTARADQDSLIQALEQIGHQGVGVFPNTMDLGVEWPKGSGAQNSTVHRELFDVIGREMSKAVLGQTTTVEPGPNGDRASTETRDKVRSDIREADARSVASALRYHLFGPAVAVNIGPNVRTPVPWFQTEESVDQLEFAQAVKTLGEAGLPIGAKWVRDEIGMPEPAEGDELLEPPTPTQVQVPGGDDEEDDDDEEEPEEEPEDDEKSLTKSDTKPKVPGADNGQEYAGRVIDAMRAHAAEELAETVAGMVTVIRESKGYAEALQAIKAKYKDIAPPVELARLTEAAILMARVGGHLSVNEDTLKGEP